MEQRRVQETAKQDATQGDNVAPTETYDVSLLKRALEMARADAEEDEASANPPPESAA